MSDFSIPGGAIDSLGTAAVPAPLSTEVRDVPLEDYKRDHYERAPVDDRKKALLLSQQETKGGPAAPEARALRVAAREAGVPTETAFTKPDTVEPYVQSWAQYADAPPVADILLDPDKRRLFSPEELQSAVDLTGAVESPLPDTGWGVGSERSKRNRMLFKTIFSADGRLSPEDEQALAQYSARERFFPRGGLGQAVLEQGPRTLRQVGIGTGAALGVGALTGGTGAVPAAAAAVFFDNFVESTGEVMGEFLDIGVPHKVARVLAPVIGAGVAGLDTVSAGAMTRIPGLNILKSKIFSVKAFRAALAAAVKTSRVRRILAELGETAVVEGSTEGVQELLQILGDHAAAAVSDTPVEAPSADDAIDRAVAAAVTGAVVGPVYSGASVVAREGLSRATRGTLAAATVERIYGATEGLQSVPKDALEDFSARVSGHTGIRTVTAPADAVRQLFQKAQEERPGEAPVPSPELLKALERADQTGGQVTMPLAQFVTEVRPLDKGGLLKDDIGLNGGMTPKAAKKVSKDAQKAMAEVAAIKAKNAGFAESPIVQDIRAKLTAVGVTPEAAQTEAEVIAAFHETTAPKRGKTAHAQYLESPLFITRHGVERAGVSNTDVALAETLLSMTPEARAAQYYTDPNTGMPNVHALEAVGQTPGTKILLVKPIGIIGLNDNIGHHVGDAMYRMHAENVRASAPGAVYKLGQAFAVEVADDAQAQDVVDRVNAASREPGWTVESAVGGTVDEAFQKLEADKNARIAAGTRPERVIFPEGTKTDKANLDRLAAVFNTKEQAPQVSPALVEAFSKLGAKEAFDKFYEPNTGALSGLGWAQARRINPKKHVLSLDLLGIGWRNKNLGRVATDIAVEQAVKQAMSLGGAELDLAHPHGDEIMAQSNDPAKLRAFAEELRSVLDKMKVKVKIGEDASGIYAGRTGEEVTLLGTGLGIGLGKNDSEAEASLNADKKRLTDEGKRDPKGAVTGVESARVRAGDRDVRGGDVQAGDVRGGAEPEDGGGPPRGRIAPPDLAELIGPQYAAWYESTRTDPARTMSESVGETDATSRGYIRFGPDADWFHVVLTHQESLSTFLHETGHYFHTLMEKYAGDSPEIAADLATVKEWAGLKPDEAWTVDAAEKFARGFEQYIREGRAPSTRLAQAFATFKAWLLRVYRSVRRLGYPINDEVRGVFDRLLATQDEMNARRLEAGYFPQADPVFGTTPLQEQYQKAWEKAARVAQEALDKRAIDTLKREVSEDYKRAKARAKVDAASHPAVSLRSFLRGEGRTDGGLAPDWVHNHVIDQEAVDRKKLPAGVYPAIKDFLGPNGIDPDELAPFFGYANASEMFESLASTPERATLESRLAKAEMSAKYPDYGMSPAWVEEQALEVLHGEDAVSNALELDLLAAYLKLNKTAPKNAAEAAKIAAQAAVLEMPVSQLDLAQARNAETEMAKAAQAAFAVKDFQAAADATMKRLYARALWLATEQAQKEVKQVERSLKRMSDPQYLGRIGRSSKAELPSGRALGLVIRDAMRYIAEATGHAEQSGVSDTLFSAYIADIEAGGAPVDVDPRLLESPISRWERVTVSEAMGIKDTLRSLAHVANDANVVRIGQDRMVMDDVATQVEQNLAGSGLLGRLGPKGEETSLARKLRTEIEKPETTVIDIDGGKPGVFHKLWIQSAEQGQFERDRRFREHRKNLDALREKYEPEGWTKLMRTKFKHVDGREYTGSQVFAMLLNLGTENNRVKLVDGMLRGGRTGWSEQSTLELIHRVFPDAKPYAYAQALLDYISSARLWEDGSKVKEAISGVRPVQEVATPITLPDGTTIPGGYFPVIYDSGAPVTDVELQTADALNAMHQSNPLSVFAKSGFTKSRTGYVAPLLLDPSALAAHIYEVDHFIANAEGIIARHKLLNHPRIKAALIHSLGRERWEALRDSNNFIASDGALLTADFLQIGNIANRMLFHASLLSMGGNVLSGVNQIVTGIPASIAHLGPRGVPAFGRALVEFAKHPFKMWRDVVEASGEIQSMEFHYDRDLRMILARQLSGETWDTVRSRIATTTMAPVVFGQKMVNVITWKAAFNLAVADGKSTAEAVAEANSSVRQSQSSSAPKDFTAAQRSHNGLMRVLTHLASYTFTLNDLVMPRRMTQKELTSSTARLVVLILTSAMLKAMFDQMFPKLEEKDREREAKWLREVDDTAGPALGYVLRSGLDTVGNVPVVGRTVQSVLTGRTPSYAGGMMETIFRAAEAAPDAFADKGLTKRQAKAVADAIGLATGIPTRNVLFGPTEFWWEYLNGNIEDSPWAFIQELTLARAGQKGDK